MCKYSDDDNVTHIVDLIKKNEALPQITWIAYRGQGQQDKCKYSPIMKVMLWVFNCIKKNKVLKENECETDDEADKSDDSMFLLLL
ncbi:hypothetical protein CEXT_814241 [Caerostris extrusa]|uniref:Uncharacterized protein n=1 Tax=Caerostris extrusa TaxID=172846 RepID=A0AAV4Y4Q0_CAEEX|nr:hypothetical protein CEXT_814241 [Caerostris extrusa]